MPNVQLVTLCFCPINVLIPVCTLTIQILRVNFVVNVHTGSSKLIKPSAIIRYAVYIEHKTMLFNVDCLSYHTVSLHGAMGVKLF